MLDSLGFDLWAKDYDNSVKVADETNEYPFAGYRILMNAIYKKVRQKQSAEILDIGFGTALFSAQLYQDGFGITGIDFSNRMLEIASVKMPKARLICQDFANGLPNEIMGNKYDYIISTYALHHVSNTEKVKLINSLCSLLKTNGQLIVGDISFKTLGDLNACKEKFRAKWDNDEVYIVYEEIKKLIDKKYILNYEKISECAGILVIAQ